MKKIYLDNNSTTKVDPKASDSELSDWASSSFHERRDFIDGKYIDRLVLALLRKDWFNETR